MSMFRFLMKRIVEILITLFIITTLIFILFRLMPADPARGGTRCAGPTRSRIPPCA